MSLGKCHRTRKPLSTYIIDIMKLKILLHLNFGSPKYIAKLISLSIYHFIEILTGNLLNYKVDKYIHTLFAKTIYCDQLMSIVRRSSSTICFKWQLLLYHSVNFNQTSQEWFLADPLQNKLKPI